MRTNSFLSYSWTVSFAVYLVLFCVFTPGDMVKHENFKKCEQSGFCKRNRAYADEATAAGSQRVAQYQVILDSIKFTNGQLQGTILKTVDANGETVRLPLTISFLQSGTARVTIDEERRQKGDIELRHGSSARKERYNEADKWAIAGGLEISKNAELKNQNDIATTIRYGPSNSFEAIIQHSPFGIEFRRDGTTEVKFNDRGFMNIEHWRPKIEQEKIGDEVEATHEEATHESPNQSTMWEESFGGSTDTKPRGPESVGLDISFLGYEYVYGIPEHAGPLSLKETRGGAGNYEEPYRLYNTDVFQYELDSPMTLYGSIPLMQAHRKNSTVGVFWLNTAETWIDIIKTKESHNPLSLGIGAKKNTQTHWFSESGILDVFVFLGPSPRDVIKSYSELTGYTQLPQAFSIAYHQCRWNYVTGEDVKDVDRKMDKFNIPYDVIWLDIEYTDEKKYFTWDPHNFPDPISIGQQLDKRNRKLVTIIDPHIKNEGGYHVADELKNKDLAVHNKDGTIYEGWCWPGSSYWIDAFNPLAIQWWVRLFRYDEFKGTLSNNFIWNDMNEPSVFNGPETTMPKDNLHHGNWEHRDIHNIYGMTYHNATFQALVERRKGEIRRPFVLTRSFYAGSQRLGAMWTGDNEAKWDHLAAAFPMLLNQGISGFPFAGADVGGFFGNPEKDLLTRWYQAGAFYPFFRGHAHIDTRRREPYLVGEPYTGIITRALRLRYSLLPAWYTAFHEASINGYPIIRPHYFVYPGDDKGFAIDDQFFVGSTGLLAKPVVTEGAESVNIYLPDDELYYDYFDYTIYTGHGTKTIYAPLDKIPLLMQGGHIIPRRDRPRRSSGLMRWDPYTLIVVLGMTGDAEGDLYVDDGETYDFQSGAFIHRTFHFSSTSNTLSSKNIGIIGKLTEKYSKTMKKVGVEKVIVIGAPASWASKTAVKVIEGGSTHDIKIEFHAAQNGRAAWALIKNLGVPIGADWNVNFS